MRTIAYLHLIFVMLVVEDFKAGLVVFTIFVVGIGVHPDAMDVCRAVNVARCEDHLDSDTFG
jgi:hypothetical protein